MLRRFTLKMMMFATAAIAASAAYVAPAVSAENAGSNATETFYDRVTPSLVAVKFTIAGETVQKDVIVSGIVVNDQGLVMIPLIAVNDLIPTAQLQHFQIIIPHGDRNNEEIDAEFQGRDERCNMAFVKAKAAESGKPESPWTPIHFKSVPAHIGDAVSSVGLLSKSNGFQPIYVPAIVSANIRGPMKLVRVAGGLAGPQSPVFNGEGQAIGVVAYELPAELNLDDDSNSPQNAISITKMFAVNASNRHFIPAAEFLASVENPPTPEHPVQLIWTGLPARLLSGLGKNDAALFHLTDQAAIQINDILSDSPAEKAGLKKKDVIVKYQGEPLERGSRPEDLPMILGHTLIQHKPGDVVTFTVISGKNQPPHDVSVLLEPEPKVENAAERYWSEEIGFGVREMVLLDRYDLKLKKADSNGVLVTILKENGSASSAGLKARDMITQINGQLVTDLSSFKSAFEQFRRDHAQEAIVLVVHRGSGDETIRIEPPQ